MKTLLNFLVNLPTYNFFTYLKLLVFFSYDSVLISPFSFFLVCMPEKIPEKSTPEPEETEMSINAKFRDIQPSSSILSYVEDNVYAITSSYLYLTLSLYECMYNIILLFFAATWS